MLFEDFDDVEWMGFNKQDLFNSPIKKIAKQPLVVLKKSSKVKLFAFSQHENLYFLKNIIQHCQYICNFLKELS